MDVVLMATRFRNKLNRFVYRYRDPLAEGVGVLLALWDPYILINAFFALKLLPHLLCRIKLEAILVLLISPVCPSRCSMLVLYDSWNTLCALPDC